MWIVYELCYPDGQPFYVGKGRPNRPATHLYQARQGRKAHRYSIIRKLWNQGLEPVVEILLRTRDEEEAFAEEIRRIAELRQSGVPIVNQLSGGEGQRHTDETRHRISESNKGKHSRPLTEEHKEKLRQARLGKRPYEMTEETRLAMSDSAKKRVRKPHSEETRRKMSEAAKRRWARDE